MALSVFSLEGKLALITGGGTGIGLGIAKAIVETGGKVVITGRREEVLKQATEELGAGNFYRVNDITNKSALPDLVNDIESNIGPIDILVNNAGITKDNVRVNAIAPGWIESNMFLNAINKDEKRKQQIVNRIAMDSFGQTSDIGNAAVFLSSEAARYITGVVLPVDGGATVNF